MIGHSLGGDYLYRRFNILTTEIKFDFARNRTEEGRRTLGDNLAAICTANHIGAKHAGNLAERTNNIQEAIINGVLQGRKQDDPRGASLVSRRKQAELFLQIVMMDRRLLPFDLPNYWRNTLKDNPILTAKRRAKAIVIERALKGWEKNALDDFDLTHELAAAIKAGEEHAQKTGSKSGTTTSASSSRVTSLNSTAASSVHASRNVSRGSNGASSRFPSRAPSRGSGVAGLEEGVGQMSFSSPSPWN